MYIKIINLYLNEKDLYSMLTGKGKYDLWYKDNIQIRFTFQQWIAFGMHEHKGQYSNSFLSYS